MMRKVNGMMGLLGVVVTWLMVAMFVRQGVIVDGGDHIELPTQVLREESRMLFFTNFLQVHI